MNINIEKNLIEIAKKEIDNTDPSHDFCHALRVLRIAKFIAKEENADEDIIIPSALFHDVISYPKNDSRRMLSSDESAQFVEKILKEIDFPLSKIEKVSCSIRCCSFTKNIKPDLLESKILQDADGLEATGAIAIMRTFSSSGILKKAFYHPDDPFCTKREPDDSKYAIDLFFTRLLKIKERLYTKTAKKLAQQRTSFLNIFLEELKKEFEI